VGQRGPKPGWKKAKQAQAANAAAAPAAKKPARAATQPTTEARKADVVVLSAADRENPEKLSGEALVKLAHRRGIALSDLAKMSDAKIREQLRYLVHRQYDEAA
jgi:pyruvate/2-oxoglutarate dehydrogenase complex dihydrolipoamide acyltransferase (E2) component